MSDGTIYKIPALSVPSIKTSLELPGIQNIAQTFVKRGYKLADSSLLKNDSVTDIDFLLGEDAKYILPINSVRFDGSSFYYESALGVLLTGRVDSLMSDITCLPANPSVNKTKQSSFVGSNAIQTSSEASDVDCFYLDNDYRLGVSVNFCVIDENGQLDGGELFKATAEIVNERSSEILDDKCS